MSRGVRPSSLALAVAALAFVAGGACKKSPPTGPATAADCDALGEAVVEQWLSRVKETDSEEAKGMTKRMAAMTSQRLVMHCTSDAWSREVVECGKLGDFAKCDALLSAEQKQKLTADVIRPR